MATFKDRKGGVWNVEITLQDLARLREAGFDLNALKTDQAVIAALTDTDIFGRVIVVVCDAEMTARGISVEDFARLCNGPTIFAAIQAIIGAVADFTQPPTVAAEFNRGLPAAWNRMEAAAAAKVKTALSGLNASAGGSPESSAVAPLG